MSLSVLCAPHGTSVMARKHHSPGGAHHRVRLDTANRATGSARARLDVSGSVLPAGDLARLQAGGAHVQTLALRSTDLRVHSLNVGVPPAAGAPVGVRDRLAEAWPLATDVADGSHVRHSFLTNGNWPSGQQVHGPARAGQQHPTRAGQANTG